MLIEIARYPIFYRMFAFFILNIWLVGMCVPDDDANLINGSGTLGSPFVIAAQRAKQGWLAHVLNAFIFLSVISCGITSVYVASRSLTSMADIRLIHPGFGWKDKAGRPWVALLISVSIGGGLCYLNCNDEAYKVYSWFSSLVRSVSISKLCLAADIPLRSPSLLSFSGEHASCVTSSFEER